MCEMTYRQGLTAGSSYYPERPLRGIKVCMEFITKLLGHLKYENRKLNLKRYTYIDRESINLKMNE